ncbi:50S ribosomal protein L22 [Candidatus Giovannonibacteria bacterium]|nr:50S ribosomal protein L22 [Candidatus Giovannonibacteria bacterium]
MKEIKAHLRYLRMAPRKVRVVGNAIRGKSAVSASIALKLMPRRPAEPLLKLLRSAVANAKHNFNISEEKLVVSGVRVDKGPILKRFMPRARGMGASIHKHSSHITIVLKESAK